MDVTYLTIPHLSTKELTRIFSKIRISDTKSYRGIFCWDWTSTLNKGYGYIAWNRRSLAAYRLLYAWLVEPLPSKASGKVIDHLCKNKRCVNPAHLELVVERVNVITRSESPAARLARKTHCKYGHPLEGNNLVQHYLPRRRCLACSQRWNKTKRVRPNRAIYNKEYRLKNAEQLRKRDQKRRQDPKYRKYMREYLKEYSRTRKRKHKPLTPEQRARKNEWMREHRRKYGRPDRPKKPPI